MKVRDLRRAGGGIVTAGEALPRQFVVDGDLDANQIEAALLPGGPRQRMVEQGQNLAGEERQAGHRGDNRLDPR